MLYYILRHLVYSVLLTTWMKVLSGLPIKYILHSFIFYIAVTKWLQTGAITIIYRRRNVINKREREREREIDGARINYLFLW